MRILDGAERRRLLQAKLNRPPGLRTVDDAGEAHR
jgi:hypothetical protein